MKVFIIAAQTIDGFIGRDSGHLADWTGKADKKVFVELTKQAGTIVMGSRTFDTIGRALPGRRNIVYTSNPAKYAHIPDIECTNEPPAQLVARLQQEGAMALAICGGTSVYDLFLRAGLVDELYLTIIPIAFGHGIRLLGEGPIASLRLLACQPLDDGAVLLHYASNK
nr:RibD C-terminal domain protein [uncultured bacterium]